MLFAGHCLFFIFGKISIKDQKQSLPDFATVSV